MKLRGTSRLFAGMMLAVVVHGAQGCEPERGSRAATRDEEEHSTKGGGGHEARAEEASSEAQWPELRRWLRGETLDVQLGEHHEDSEEVAASRGALLFRQNCSECHGEAGRGDGPRASELDPKPPDLTRGSFKFRSTETGGVPTPEDIFRTISLGLRGTAMLAFADLSESERWDLVAYVRSLSPRFAARGPALVPRPDPPADMTTRARIERGRQAYEFHGCPTCHGQTGRGDGLAAPTLTTDEGRPERAPDFVAWPLKHGDFPDAVLRTLVTGMDGTPMPSYREAATDEQLRDLVAFVWWLRSPEAASVTEQEKREVKQRIDRQYAQALRTLGLSL